jgi:hypothetical protein
VKRKDEKLEQQNQEIIKLQADKERLNQAMSEKDKNLNERFKHIEDVMDKRVADIGLLPAECPNARCEREYNGFKLERKGNTVYGRGEGEWKIRCKCRAVLN